MFVCLSIYLGKQTERKYLKALCLSVWQYSNFPSSLFSFVFFKISITTNYYCNRELYMYVYTCVPMCMCE